MSAALARFKLAGPAGADYGVAPRGPELSHGTALNAYPPLATGNVPAGNPYDAAARAKAEGATDLLWNLSEYDRLAPGGAGDYGQETIG